MVFACPSTKQTTALRCATSCSRGRSRHFSAPPRAARRRSATGKSEARRDRRPLLRRRAVPLPDYPVAPGDRNAVRRQPAGLAEAGDAVGAEGLSLEQSAIFIHAIDFTAFDYDAGIGVGKAATEGADIISCEPREGLRRCGRDESDAQPQRQAQQADAYGYDETRDLHSIPHATGSTRAMRPVLMALSRFARTVSAWGGA